MLVDNPLGIDIFELVIWLVEFIPHVTALTVLLWCILQFSSPSSSSSDVKTTAASSNAVRVKGWLVWYLPVGIAFMAVTTFLASWEDAYRRGYDIFKLPSLRTKLEDYIETGNSDLHEIMESNKYAPTMGYYEIRYFIQDLFRHSVFHSDSHNEDNIDEGYNKGNDWFQRMLGETMMYTCGLYPNGNETLTQAQNYKIDYVADAIQLKPGHSVLDIGCGWSYLAKRLTEVHGANVTAITLSKEQHKWGTEWNANNDVNILFQDAMKLNERTDLPKEGFDRITNLEMAEHVGIRRYQQFLKIVRDNLKDDGVFYFQVAGLRRHWRFEDLVWGLFMGEHVFPGADASCPLGWVSTQLERGGFEIQRVHNMGSHYSRTLAQWLENWRSNQEYLVAKYGAKAYRRWEVFLAWSVRVARQGSSTLFMFTLTKAGVHDSRRIETQAHVVPKDVPTF